MSAPLATDSSAQLRNNIYQPKSEPIDTHSTLAMQPQHSAPPASIILRSTVLNTESHHNPPLHSVSALGALPGTSIPPAMYQQLGILPDNNPNTNVASGIFDSSGALLPGLTHAQMESMLAMAGAPIPGHQLGDHQLETHQQAGPISETARKEAAAAARAARQAKRRTEKQKKQERTRKTHNLPVANMQPIANTNFATAVSMAAVTPAIYQGASLPPVPEAPIEAAEAHPQPSTSQQPPKSFSKREKGKKTSSAAGNKSEQRAVS